MVDEWKPSRTHSEVEDRSRARSVAEEGSGTSNDADKNVEFVREKYKALLEGAPDAIFIADADSGTVVEANQSAASLLESTVEEIVGRHQSELHPPEEAERYGSFFRSHQRAAEGNGGATFRTLEDGSQICVITDTGNKIPVEINASFIDLNDGKLFVGIFRDITERLRREEELREAKETAEAASELKAAMLRNMSHEIRTPITSIIGFSKILADSLKGTRKGHAENIHQASQHLMKTIDSVLELSKLEANVHDLEREAARLDESARWAVELLDRQAENDDVELQTALPEHPVEGIWNQEGLNLIAEHLLENAIKFTPAGGAVELRVGRDGGEAFLEVEDTGIGMEADEVAELFKPFEQASDGLTREYDGVGLGLSIVKELTEALGGRIEVDTEKGQGSRFTLWFPCRREEGAVEDVSE